ncbi:MAG: hypothetical protein ACOZCL_15595 [Bacillota bacterium]
MKRLLSVLVVVSVFLSSFAFSMTNADEALTIEKNMTSAGSSSYHFEYNGKDTYVALGAGSVARVSKDGKTWENVDLGKFYTILDIIWADNVFVAVGDNVILISEDGRDWQEAASGLTSDTYAFLDRVEYINNMFFAFSYSGIMVSEDGFSWLNTGMDSYYVSKIIWDGEQFVGIGYYGTSTSADGYDWTEVQAYDFIGSENAYVSSILLSNGKLFLSTSDYSYDDEGNYIYDNRLFISDNGVDWTEISITGLDYVQKALYSGGKYIILSYSYDNNYNTVQTIYTSSNGKTWNSYKTNYYLMDIATSGSKYVAAGYDGVILSSSDGKRWSKAKSGTSKTFWSVSYINKKFIARSSNAVYTSTNGITWKKTTDIDETAEYYAYIENAGDISFVVYDSMVIAIDKNNKATKSDSISEALNALTEKDGKYTAVGMKVVATSTDGAKWTKNTVDMQTYMYFDDIVWAKDKYVAVGGWYGQAVLGYSEDGTNWDISYDESITSMVSVAASENMVVAVGNGNTLYSEDGITWESLDLGMESIFEDVDYLDNRFITVGSDGAIMLSDDGTTWTISKSGTDAWLYSSVWTGSEYLVYGSYDGELVCVTSKDGKKWSKKTQKVTLASDEGDDSYYSISSVIYDKGQYIAVGSHVFTSKDGVNWNAYTAADWLTDVVKTSTGYMAVGYNGAIYTIKLNN